MEPTTVHEQATIHPELLYSQAERLVRHAATLEGVELSQTEREERSADIVAEALAIDSPEVDWRDALIQAARNCRKRTGSGWRAHSIETLLDESGTVRDRDNAHWRKLCLSRLEVVDDPNADRAWRYLAILQDEDRARWADAMAIVSGADTYLERGTRNRRAKALRSTLAMQLLQWAAS